MNTLDRETLAENKPQRAIVVLHDGFFENTSLSLSISLFFSFSARDVFILIAFALWQMWIHSSLSRITYAYGRLACSVLFFLAARPANDRSRPIGHVKENR